MRLPILAARRLGVSLFIQPESDDLHPVESFFLFPFWPSSVLFGPFFFFGHSWRVNIQSSISFLLFLFRSIIPTDGRKLPDSLHCGFHTTP